MAEGATNGKRGAATFSAARDVTLVLVALLQALLLFVAAQAAHRFDVTEARAEHLEATVIDQRERIATLEAQYESIQRSLVRIEQAVDRGNASR